MSSKTMARIGALLVLAVSAITFPSLASAGSYLYTVTDNSNNTSFSFYETTLASTGTVTPPAFFNVTPGDTVNVFNWNSAAGAFCKIGGVESGPFPGGCAADYINTSMTFFGFAAGSFLSTGTYISNDPTGMTVEIQSIPEPSAVAVLGSGLLFVAGGLWRKLRS